ncbi:MAG: TlpA family protein disulfide reductase [Candidatus Limnocylindria bacterium]
MAVTAGTDARAGRPRPARPPFGGALPRGWLILSALAPLLLLAAWGGLLVARDAGSGARVGAAAPPFALVDLDGDPLRLADLRGRPVIVNFWASWCGPCVEEFPLLARAAADHAPEGLVLVGIVFRDNSESARAFMSRMGAAWSAAMDPGEEVAVRYGIYGPPETFFIDADGVVAARQIGQLSAADLDRHLGKIVGQGESE